MIVILGAGSEARRGLFKLGHFAAARWQVADQRRAEVLVSGEGLHRGPIDVLGTLLHEAAHGMADARQIQDTSRQGRYHNRRYAHLASELGLQVACDPATGWSQTTIPDQLAAVYADVLTDLAAALVLWRYAEQQRGGQVAEPARLRLPMWAQAPRRQADPRTGTDRLRRLRAALRGQVDNLRSTSRPRTHPSRGRPRILPRPALSC